MSFTGPVAARVAAAPTGSAPRFVVGQDERGRWVAIEVHGLAGGLFRTREAAWHYAVDATGRRPDAVTVAMGRIAFRV